MPTHNKLGRLWLWIKVPTGQRDKIYTIFSLKHCINVVNKYNHHITCFHRHRTGSVPVCTPYFKTLLSILTKIKLVWTQRICFQPEPKKNRFSVRTEMGMSSPTGPCVLASTTCRWRIIGKRAGLLNSTKVPRILMRTTSSLVEKTRRGSQAACRNPVI